MACAVMVSDAPNAKLAYATAEQVARESYGRLLAWLAYQWRDVAAAEEALSTALAKALALWPTQGVPDAPQAWLLSVAKRELLQAARHQRLHASPEVQALLQGDSDGEGQFGQHDQHGPHGQYGASDKAYAPPAIPDDRLKLLFVCAHPAIDASVRPALMLQTVMGLDAQVVAQAMLTSPAAMAQRLVRAKQKIRIARLRFEEPDACELPERLHAVLEAIYAAYGLGWDALDGGDERVQGLRAEALFLGELVSHLLPDQAEAKGLLALMLFCEARSAARNSARKETGDEAPNKAEGNFIPLAQQDTQRWNRDQITAANALLWQPAVQNTSASKAPATKPTTAQNNVGPFQIEAAIQSAHCERLNGHGTPWAAIAHLYGRLLDLAPTLGAQVAHALAWANCGELDKAEALLTALAHPGLHDYQAFWVARAHVARLRGDTPVADHHLTRAIGLTTSPTVRRYLQGQLGA
jgi:RNA polymerase sigma-70 factor, ECF subfamily